MARKRHSRSSPWLLLLRVLVFFSVLIWFGLAATAYRLLEGAQTPEIILPQLEGLRWDKAVGELKKRGLLPEIVPIYGEDTMAGRVSGTTPAANTHVKPGRKVTLYVVQGSGLISVPDLVGHPSAEAENILRRAGLDSGLQGLRIGSLVSVASDFPPGTVLAQNPPAGERLKPGSPVDITVAASPNANVMPDLVRMDFSSARLLLAEKGITHLTTEPYYTELSPDRTVLTQIPPPGSPIDDSTVVHLVVAVPPGTFLEFPEEQPETDGGPSLGTAPAPISYFPESPSPEGF
ncbi:MAG: PASTA domain-containing protein [Candidatus Hydrogenedentota bacterium]|nr:MAG: PASTA domain-containing protein [Candidatus Hydrogenedentota bacterium]